MHGRRESWCSFAGRAVLALLASAAVFAAPALADCRHHTPPKADAFPWDAPAAGRPVEKQAPAEPPCPCRGPDCVKDAPTPTPAPAPPGPPPSPPGDAILPTTTAPDTAPRASVPPPAAADPLTLSNPVYRPPRLS